MNQINQPNPMAARVAKPYLFNIQKTLNMAQGSLKQSKEISDEYLNQQENLETELEKTNQSSKEISSKLLAPIRKFIPSAGGLDFSPIFALILIRQLEILLASIIRSIV